MPLATGARLGPYEVLAAIGAGGMGEVYRARDTKLNRDVAIKVLPDLFARDPESLTRFTREAQSLAALNHPNIAQVFAVLEEPAAVVMEFVDGEDIAHRLERGAIPVDDAIPFALQMACGLEAAHERGIVHRDLKPANVRLTPGGTIKILDFGLAKAVDPAGGSGALPALESPTFTSPPTAVGMIVGTAAYMSPEQARGKPVDKRTDIWAFGVVLYEMVAGRRPFDGETVTDALAAVVKEEPDWTALSPTTPPSLRRLIGQCLVKDPKQRLRDIGDARIVLERIVAGTAEAPTSIVPARAGRPRAAALAIGVVAIAAAAALATWLLSRPAPAAALPVARFVTPLPLEAMPLRTSGAGLAFSPDGRTVVYAAQPALMTAPVLFRRKLDSLTVERIPNTDGAYAPFFSPDGKWIGFFTDTSVMKLAVDGGSVSKICNRGRYSRATWAPDGTIVLGTSVAFAPGTLGKVPASGGEPSDLTKLTGPERLHQMPTMLPDGRHVTFLVLTPERYELAVASLDSGAHTLLKLEGSGALFVPPGHLIFARGDAIYAVGFDPATNQVRGSPVQVMEDGAVFSTGPQVHLPLMSADASGSVAYVNKGGSITELRWMTPGASPLPLPDADYRQLVLSPDGRRAGVTIGASPPDVWTIDLERGTRLRLTFTGGNSPVWSPDGARIAFWSQAQGLMTVASDGSGKPQTFGERPENMVLLPSTWSRDGKAVIVVGEDRGAGRGIRNRDILIAREAGKPAPLLATPADERAASVSPDGHWFAYASSVSGREEVYVRPFDSGGGTIPVSTEGGTFPRWRQEAIYFLSAKGIMRATVTLNPLKIGAPVLATAVPATIGGADTAADGRVLVIQQKNEAAARDLLHVLLNWGPNLR